MRRFLCNSVGMERDAVLLRFGRDRLAVYQDSAVVAVWLLTALDDPDRLLQGAVWHALGTRPEVTVAQAADRVDGPGPLVVVASTDTALRLRYRDLTLAARPSRDTGGVGALRRFADRLDRPGLSFRRP